MSEFKSFISFFDKVERLKFLFLSLSFFFLALIEAFGIALIFPVVGMFQNENFIYETESETIIYIFSLTSNLIPGVNALIIFTLIFAVIYILKSLLSFIIQSYQINYVWNIQKKLENNLFKNYLFSPYEFHVQRQSSNLLKNIIQETSKVGNTILSFAHLISSSATIIMIITLMFIVDPLISLAALLIFFLTNLIIFFNARKKITILGEKRFDYNEKRIESYSSGINNIKDIKVNEHENLFVKYAKEFNEKYFNSEKKIDIINILPVLVTELVFIIGVIIILHYINLISADGINQFIPKLSVFVAASIKLIPSINKAAIMVNKIKYNFKAVNSIKSDINLNPEIKNYQENVIFNLSNEIQIENLGFSFNKEKNVFKDINLSIKKNSAICIYGPSGIGKSTLLDLLLGILKPSKGDVNCDGISIYKNLKSWRKQIGFVPQNINIIEDTLKNNIIQNCSGIINSEDLNKIINQADLNEFSEKLPNKLNTIIREKGKNISGGQKQRIGIARALAKKPKILILDEPTSALDINSKLKINDTLNKLKKNITIILVTHDIKNVKFCDQFYSFEKNEIYKNNNN